MDIAFHRFLFQYRAAGILLLVLYFAGIPSANAQDAPFNPLKERCLAATIKNLQYSLARLTHTYRHDLEVAKQIAIQNADPAEVKAIVQAIQGISAVTFCSDAALAARKTYERGLIKLAAEFQKGVTAGVVQLLKDGRLDDAMQLKTIEEYLAYNIDAMNDQKRQEKASAGPKTKVIRNKFELEANKDWQDTAVVLPPGSKITVKAKGRWAPGNRSAAKGETESVRYKLDDADVYNFELRVQGKTNINTGGTSWTFNSGDGGSLTGRMKDYSPQTRSDAQGSISVLISWDELKKEEPKEINKPTEPLEVILARYLPDGGKEIFDVPLAALGSGTPQQPGAKTTTEAEAGKTADETTGKAKLYKRIYRLKVRAEKDWQIFPIEIKTGDKLQFTASGSWTPDTGTKVPAGAETFNYSLKIGGAEPVNAGAEYSTTAAEKGKLLLRISSREWIVSSKAKASGELELTLTLEREGEEIR